jgi:hypothetical protein
MSKEDRNPKEERKTRPEMHRGEEPAETAREKRAITISQNSRIPRQIKLKKNKSIHTHKR